jgi:hypothetical protein
VKKMWSSEEEVSSTPNEVPLDTEIESLVFFFFLSHSSNLYVALVLRDADQTTTGIHPDSGA